MARAREIQAARVFMPKMQDTEELAIFQEMVQHADTFIGGQYETAIAADQRAMNIAVILATVVAALLATAVALLPTQIDCRWEYFFGLVSAALILCLALYGVAWTARPQVLYHSGIPPEGWLPQLKTNPSLMAHLAYFADDLQEHIDTNAEALKMNSRTLVNAVRLAIFAAPIGVAVFFAAAWNGVDRCPIFRAVQLQVADCFSLNGR